MSEYLKQITSGVNVKFSWIGGEDKESLVLGKGRPFFAEIIKPKRRIIVEHNVSLNEKGIELFGTKYLQEFTTISHEIYFHDKDFNYCRRISY